VEFRPLLVAWRRIGARDNGDIIRMEVFAMDTRWYSFDGTAHISLSGKFDGECIRVFRLACNSAVESEHDIRVEVDLREVSYLDSAALSMLVLLREKANAVRKAVSLKTRPGAVRDVLANAHFERLFAFE
jgi:anti-anti-sigma factor